MVGPEILFSIYQCCFLEFYCVKWLHKAGSSPTNLTSAGCVGQPSGPEVAPPSVFNGRNCSEAVTIVRDTSAINSSRSLMLQSMCMIGTPSEVG